MPTNTLLKHTIFTQLFISNWIQRTQLRQIKAPETNQQIELSRKQVKRNAEKQAFFVDLADLVDQMSQSHRMIITII